MGDGQELVAFHHGGDGLPLHRRGLAPALGSQARQQRRRRGVALLQVGERAQRRRRVAPCHSDTVRLAQQRRRLRVVLTRKRLFAQAMRRGGAPLARRLRREKRLAAAALLRALRRSPRETRPTRRRPLVACESARAHAERERRRGGRTCGVAVGGCALACALALRCRWRLRLLRLRCAPLLAAARATGNASRCRRSRLQAVRDHAAASSVSTRPQNRTAQRSAARSSSRACGLKRLMSRAKRFLSKLMPPASRPRNGSPPGAAITAVLRSIKAEQQRVRHR